MTAPVGCYVRPVLARTGARSAELLTALISACVVLVVGAFVLSTYQRLSPIDELQHLDSSIKASQGRWYLPRGELIGPEAMRIEACSGIDAGFVPPPCDSDRLEPSQFQELGVNTAAGRPSLFYIVTGYAARVLSEISGAGFLLSARIVSLYSLVAAAALLAWAVLRLSGSRLLAVSLATASALLPPVLSLAITVNPDAWSLLAGTAVSVLALAALRWRPGRVLWVLAVALALTISVKPNFVVLLLIPLILAGHAWWRERSPVSAHRFWATLAAAVLAFGAFAGTLILPLIGSSAFEDPQTERFSIPSGSSWPLGQAFEASLTSFVPLFQGATVDVFERVGMVGLASFVGVMLVSGSMSGLVSAPARSRAFALCAAGVGGLLATPVIVFGAQYVSNVYFGYPQRYSFVVLPVLALAWAALRPRRRWVFSLASVGLATSTFYSIVLFSLA